MAKAIYPGSFDPVTLGHLDIIARASDAVDHLIIGVLNNSAKNPLFTVAERVAMLEKAVAHLPNVEVQAFDGLSVEFAKQTGSSIIVRGLRAITDFEYELQMSQTNRKIAPEVDTIFFTTSLQYAYLSSSIVKEVAKYHGNITEFVPQDIAEQVMEKIHLEKEKKHEQ